MKKSLFITGTDTGIGKTFVTGYLAALLRNNGINAVPYKPIQSGGINTNGKLLSEDVAFYQSLTSLPYSQEELCTYCLEDAVSPHLAIKKANKNVKIAAIKKQLTKLQAENDFVLVEGAGGLAVPLLDEQERLYMTTDLIRDLQLPLLIVTEPHLGMINHTLMTVAYAQLKEIPIIGFIVNNMPTTPTRMQQDNIEMIEKISGFPILGMIPPMKEPIVANTNKMIESEDEVINLPLLFEKIEIFSLKKEEV